MWNKSTKIIPGVIFFVKEFQPNQRILASREFSPFMWMLKMPLRMRQLFPRWLIFFSIKFMKMRSFYTVRLRYVNVYFRRWGR